MSITSAIHAANGMAVGFRNALINPARRERTVLLSILLYAVLWAIYGTIAKGSQGLHSDMTEVIVWSRDLSLGYLKHPPLAAWVARTWFSVLPVAEWSYYLLAMLMPAIALWFAWRLSADYLDIEKRVVGLALLTLVPFFNFHALKFNVNTVLMPVWAATTFWFLRSYQTQSALYAALAGAGAAACMLGKYWSVFLLAGLVVAALIDARRARYFRSASPWITVGVGVLSLAPHLVWLVQNNFMPFSYAMTVHSEQPLMATVQGVAGYLAGSIGYVAIPLIVVMLAAWPSRTTIVDIIWPADADRRLVAAAFWTPLLLPIIGALSSRSEITSLWSMPCWTLLPVFLLSSSAIRLNAADTRRLLIAAVAMPVIMLIAAPAIAIQVQRTGPPPAAAHARLLAAQAESAWHEATPLPLRFVGGDVEIAYDLAAAAVDQPRALPNMPAPTDAELAKAGMVLVCFSEDLACVHASQARAPKAIRIESDILRNYFGLTGKPQRYTITIVPPQP
jgi:4-amino-4-deoxy-L-arabinose transferase-like glycosyltransferase